MNPIVPFFLKAFRTLKMQFLALLLLSLCSLASPSNYQIAEAKALQFLAQQDPAAKQPAFPAGNAYAKASISAKLIPAEGNTWGYDILVEGERFIHQPSKPGLPGNRGFATKEKAQKVANLMIQKMKKGEIPPSVSIEEMKKLKAL